MLRNIFIALTLAALCATLASAATSTRATRTHRAGKQHHSASAASHVEARGARRAQGQGHSVSLHGTSARKHASTHSAATFSTAPTSRRTRHAAVRRTVPFSAARITSEAAPRTASLTRRHTVSLAPMVGSAASLARQNRINEEQGLERILDDDDLNDRIAQHLLVPVPSSSALAVNPDLPENRRYCRSWTGRFLTDLAAAHAHRFHRPLLVTSAVRTVEFQKQLILTNGNAAAAEGDIVSPHLTGATIDIAKGTMSRQELAWIRSWLLPLQLDGQIDVEEEFQQACFHITVYKSYEPPSEPVPTPKPHHRHPGTHAEFASRGQ